jgi:hypothetical protein
LKVKAARWVNILEEPSAEAGVEVKGDVAKVALDFRAFELKSLMLDLA